MSVLSHGFSRFIHSIANSRESLYFILMIVFINSLLELALHFQKTQLEYKIDYIKAVELIKRYFHLNSNFLNFRTHMSFHLSRVLIYFNGVLFLSE